MTLIKFRAAFQVATHEALKRYVPQIYTAAQKSDPQNFHEGQVLLFHHGTKEIGKNEALEVVRVEKHKIVGRNAAGRERELTAKQAKCFEVFRRQAVEIAPSDKLLLTANRRESGFRALPTGKRSRCRASTSGAGSNSRMAARYRRTTGISITATLSRRIAVRASPWMPW